MIIGVDGMAWEMIAPLLAGSQYPLVDWRDPIDLTDDQDWKPLGEDARPLKEPLSESIRRLDDRAFPGVSGLSRSFAVDRPKTDRYRVEAEARGVGKAGRLTLGVEYAFPNGGPPAMYGNNETVCRTFELTDSWQEISLELQPPTTATAFSVALMPGRVDCVEPRFERSTDDGSRQPLAEVRTLRLRSGKLRGFPEGGFDPAKPFPRQNRLPNIAALIHRGASGYLQNLEPTLSPVIWTSVATGEGPEVHGVAEFLSPAPGTSGRMPVGSTDRRVPALWNIVTDYGEKSVGVASWWASWPAEKVRGFVLTDRVNEAYVRIFEDRGLLPTDATVRAAYGEFDTYPRELAARLRGKAGTKATLQKQDLERLLPRLDEATWEESARLERVDMSDRLSLFKFYYLKDLLTFRTSLPLFEEMSPDLWMVYFNGQDALQHFFWHWEDPDLFPRVDRSREALFGQVVESYYRLIDDFIGQIVAAAGPTANVFILSDHGIHAVDFMQAETRSGGHRWRSPGILIAAGPAIKKGHHARAARIYDIAPTVLDLMGYPVATRLRGRPLDAILDPEWRRTHPTRKVAAYEFRTPRIDSAIPADSEFDEEMINRLRTLGYLP